MWIVALIFGTLPAMVFFDWADFEDPITMSFVLVYWTFLMMSVLYFLWSAIFGYRRHVKAGLNNPLRYQLNYAIILGSIVGAGIGPVFGAAGTMLGVITPLLIHL